MKVPKRPPCATTAALLYLNSYCKGGLCNYTRSRQPHFGGGEFVWNDEKNNQKIEPTAGQLIMFTGGRENLHQVRKVSHGVRYVIGMWFTCHAELQYRV